MTVPILPSSFWLLAVCKNWKWEGQNTKKISYWAVHAFMVAGVRIGLSTFFNCRIVTKTETSGWEWMHYAWEGMAHMQGWKNLALIAVCDCIRFICTNNDVFQLCFALISQLTHLLNVPALFIFLPVLLHSYTSNDRYIHVQKGSLVPRPLPNFIS